MSDAVRLETDRLLLRRFRPDDLADFVALHEDPEVTRFIRPLDRAAAEARLRLDQREWEERGHGLLALVDRESGAFLGRSGLKHWPQFGETELGWALCRTAWGRGYATEAGRAVSAWAFSRFDLPYLTAMVDPANERSIGVAERLGFAMLREDTLLGGPVVVYALFAKRGA